MDSDWTASFGVFMSEYKRLINLYEIGDPISDDDLKKIQRGLVYLLGEIVKVCDEHNMKPFVIAGSLIGKVRHDGFIPWDDDLDLGMVRDDYDKFIDIFEKELSERYVISAPFKGYNATNRFIQLGRKETVLQAADAVSDSQDLVTNHLYIDIFPFDYVPDNALLRKLKGIYCNFLMSIAGSVSYMETRNDSIDGLFKHDLKGRIELIARVILGKLFAFRTTSEWMTIVNNAVRCKKRGKYIANTVGRRHYFGEMIKTCDVLPLTKSNYCGVKIAEINNPDAYLTTLYGKYMEIPPIEKRECHHAVKIDIPDYMIGK